jgi:hypothetical protein
MHGLHGVQCHHSFLSQWLPVMAREASRAGQPYRLYLSVRRVQAKNRGCRLREHVDPSPLRARTRNRCARGPASAMRRWRATRRTAGTTRRDPPTISASRLGSG